MTCYIALTNMIFKSYGNYLCAGGRGLGMLGDFYLFHCSLTQHIYLILFSCGNFSTLMNGGRGKSQNGKSTNRKEYQHNQSERKECQQQEYQQKEYQHSELENRKEYQQKECQQKEYQQSELEIRIEYQQERVQTERVPTVCV